MLAVRRVSARQHADYEPGVRYIPNTRRKVSTSVREPTMMYRYSPRRVERIHEQTQLVRRERPSHQQGAAGGLNLAEGRDHAGDGRAVRV